MQDMVKMSPLQGSYFQIVPTSHDMAVDRRGGGEPGEMSRRARRLPTSDGAICYDFAP